MKELSFGLLVFIAAIVSTNHIRLQNMQEFLHINVYNSGGEMSEFRDKVRKDLIANRVIVEPMTKDEEIDKLKELMLEAAEHLTCEFDECDDFDLADRLREAAK